MWGWKQEVSQKSPVPGVEAHSFNLPSHLPTPLPSSLTHGSGRVDPAQPGAQSRAGPERCLPILEEVALVAGVPVEPTAECRAGRTGNSTVKTRKEDKAESPLGEMRAAQGGQRSEQRVRRVGEKLATEEAREKTSCCYFWANLALPP